MDGYLTFQLESRLALFKVFPALVAFHAYGGCNSDHHSSVSFRAGFCALPFIQ
jgi:hypothetical protein